MQQQLRREILLNNILQPSLTQIPTLSVKFERPIRRKSSVNREEHDLISYRTSGMHNVQDAKACKQEHMNIYER